MPRCLERQSIGGAYLCAARVLAPCAPNSWWCRAQAAHHSARSCCPETSLSRMIKLNNNNRSLHTALHVSHIWAPHLLDHMRYVPGTVWKYRTGVHEPQRTVGTSQGWRSLVSQNCRHTRRVRLTRARKTNWARVARTSVRSRARRPLRVKVCKMISAPCDTIASAACWTPASEYSLYGCTELASERASARYELRSPRSLPRCRGTNRERAQTCAASHWRSRAPRPAPARALGFEDLNLAGAPRPRSRESGAGESRAERWSGTQQLRHTTKIFLVMEREWTWTRNRANGWRVVCRSPRDGVTRCRRAPLARLPASLSQATASAARSTSTALTSGNCALSHTLTLPIIVNIVVHWKVPTYS